MIHFDIEDGSFVPIMTLGTKVIKDLRPLTKLPFDVHLMMVNPEWIIPEIARYGADRVSVHYEACRYPRRTLGLIAQYNMQPGLAFNPNSAVPPLQFCLPYLSYVLILTTEPEVESCSYLPAVLTKVVEGKKQPRLESVEWSVDGGITADNIQDVIAAGADIVVSGRGIFSNGQVRENICKMKYRC
jgi:ribulose-phosphate 3-epimerase